MASELTNIMSQDIFSVTKFIDKLKAKYIDVPEDTLFLGVYGYLTAVFGNLIQNTAIQTSEYSKEAIPTRAKFERNIISHALALGLKKIAATPAQLDVLIGFPEDFLVSNMKNNIIIIDKDIEFTIGDRAMYPYHLDYDIKIRRNVLPNGKIVYTALYNIDNKSPYADRSNPYLPALGELNKQGQRLITLQTSLRQMSHTLIERTIIVDNPLETKTLSFEFDDQMAFFYVEVTEHTDDGDKLHYLEPIYEGLYDYRSDDEYINYMYLDEKTIRVKFNRNSYQPKNNCDIEIHVYTTYGAECNLYLDEAFHTIKELTSSKYEYNSLMCWIQYNQKATYGENRANIEELKQFIPKEMFARGSYSTYTDLNTFFNIIQTENCKMKLLERVHNQIERIFFSYLLMKHDGLVVPTNTIDIVFDKNIFSSYSKDNYILSPNTSYYLKMGQSTAEVINLDNYTDEDIEKLEKTGFIYSCPFLTVINKSPFYVSFYNIYPSYNRTLYFEYINEKSELQFVQSGFSVERKCIEDNDTVTFKLQVAQNINSDYDLLIYNSEGELIECKIIPYLVFYTEDGNGDMQPYRYAVGELYEYIQSTRNYFFEFTLTTSNIIYGKSVHMLFDNGLYSIGTGEETPSYLPTNIYAKVFVLVKEDADYGREYGERMEKTVDELIPNVRGYSLTNIYNTGTAGIDLFYDYSDIMSSYIELNKNNGLFSFKMHKVPCVRKIWWNSETRARYFFSMLDYRRRYIQQAIKVLEDSFGINFKLYNTYGPSINYNINRNSNIDRINVSLKFEIMFVVKEDQSMLGEIKQSIKEYIEDLNGTTDLHIPNLITYIKNLYNDTIEYIKFIKLNDYESLWQSIYKNPEVADNYFTETQNVPEFINIHTLANDEPDIEFDVIT